ncbi:HMA2 domain-containing protein [Mailhella massiliensis]|uniref:Heavy-metal-associated domain-containing protein n=1 Tax=Mailhella massiliensis TaxID=1903261 RepID=A0A921DRX0_9BACT|nr:cation transporter [Mailhella massiliensis]HJD97939.1 heavy-metal-associated domain-containing protein [Mailhella massiliensis]
MVSITDCITSFIDGRVRLRHEALKDPSTADMVTALLGGVDGVESVRANPLTGSLLIFYDAEKLSRETLLELARQGAALLPEEEKGRGRARGPASELMAMVLSRSATRLANRAMLVSLLLSLAGAFAGGGSLHRAAGAAFALASLQHMAAHRKTLW